MRPKMCGYMFGIGLACLGPGIASAQVREHAIGCWSLTYSPWIPSPGGDSILYQPLPAILKLRGDSATRPGYLSAIREPATPPKVVSGWVKTLVALWKPLTHDSVEVWLPVSWSTGVTARLEVRGDSMFGKAVIYVDFPNGSPTSEVLGIRTPCVGG